MKRTPYLSLLRSRNVWAVIAARVLADPWVWFYYFWIPEYLARSAGFTAADIGKYAWIPFAAQGVGIVLGGAFSDWLCRRGMSVHSFATHRDADRNVVDDRRHSWRPSIFGITHHLRRHQHSDAGLRPVGAEHDVVVCRCFSARLGGIGRGLGRDGAGAGGMVFTMATGWTLDTYGYAPVFIAAGAIPLLAFAVLFTLLRDRKQVQRVLVRTI